MTVNMFLNQQIYSLYLCWPKKMHVKEGEAVRSLRVSSTLPRESVIRGGTLPPRIYTLQILVSNQLNKSPLLSDMILTNSTKQVYHYVGSDMYVSVQVLLKEYMDTYFKSYFTYFYILYNEIKNIITMQYTPSSITRKKST